MEDKKKVYAFNKGDLKDLFESMSYDGWIHLPLYIYERLQDESFKDKAWKKTCEDNGWEFPTKESMKR